MPRTRAAAAAAKDKITKSTVTVKRSAVKKSQEKESRPKRKAAVRAKTATKTAPATTSAPANTTAHKRKPTQDTPEPTNKRNKIDFVARNKENIRTTAERKSTKITPTTKKPVPTPRTSKVAPPTQTKNSLRPARTEATSEISSSPIKQIEQTWALSSFDREVDAKCRALQHLKTTLLQQLETERAVQLARIPQGVREMKVSELQKQHQGDLELAHRGLVSHELALPSLVDLSGLLEISASDLSQLSQRRRGQLRQHLASLMATLE